MTHFSITVEIPAPPERVWAVLADIERWSEWTLAVRSIERLDRGPLAVGSRARIRQPRLPPATWQVSALQPGRGFTWITRSPGVCVTGEHRVEATARGTRVLLSLRFSGVLGPLMARLTRKLNQRYLALEAKGLSERTSVEGLSRTRTSLNQRAEA